MTCKGCPKRYVQCGWTCHRAGMLCRCLTVVPGMKWYPKGHPSEPVRVVSLVGGIVTFKTKTGEQKLSVSQFETQHNYNRPTRWDYVAEE